MAAVILPTYKKISDVFAVDVIWSLIGVYPRVYFRDGIEYGKGSQSFDVQELEKAAEGAVEAAAEENA